MKLWPWLEANKNRIIGVAAAILVIAGIYSFITWQHEQAELSAGQAFTDLLMAPPAGNPSQEASALEALAAKYSGTAAGARSQLQAASVLYDAGNYTDAQAQFQKYLDGQPGGVLASIAQLGVAASLEAQGQLDAAFAAYEKVVAGHSASSEATSAEFALGRIAEKQGKLEAAASYYEQAAQARQMGGSLAQEAYGRMLEIKSKLAAANKTQTPAPAASTAPLIPFQK